MGVDVDAVVNEEDDANYAYLWHNERNGGLTQMQADEMTMTMMFVDACVVMLTLALTQGQCFINPPPSSLSPSLLLRPCILPSSFLCIPLSTHYTLVWNA